MTMYFGGRGVSPCVFFSSLLDRVELSASGFERIIPGYYYYYYHYHHRLYSPAGPLPPQANVASDLYPAHPPANFYNPVSLRLPLPRQSILISVGDVLVDLQSLSTIYF
jgi:hypothetical protein